jgi:hypothetical protein
MRAFIAGVAARVSADVKAVVPATTTSKAARSREILQVAREAADAE